MVSKTKQKKKKKSSPKLRLSFRPKSEIQTFFRPKIRWSLKRKKKKKKRSSPKLRLIYRPKSEIQTFFRPKIRWSPTRKKKKVFTEIETDLSAKFGNSNVWGGLFFYGGGLFSIFHKNRPQKHQKLAILHTSQANGGARAPPLPLWLRYWSSAKSQVTLKLIGTTNARIACSFVFTRPFSN